MKVNLNSLIEIHSEMLVLFLNKGYSDNEVRNMEMSNEELISAVKDSEDIYQLQEKLISAMYEKYTKHQIILDKILSVSKKIEQSGQPIGLQKREIELNSEFTRARTFVESIFTRISNQKKLDKPKIETIKAELDTSLISYHDDDSDQEIQQVLFNV